MIDFFNALLSYSFLQRAFFIGILVSLCLALLGVSLVLKRYSMIGDGLSHVGFGALSIAMAFNLAPLAISIPVVIIAAFLLLRLNDNSKIKGDSAIAMVASSSLAIGAIVTSLKSGMTADVCNYMFGSILAMTNTDVWITAIVTIVVIVLYVLFYNRMFAVTFDESFATATGINAKKYNMILAFLTAVTIVVGMRMMGALLISSLVIFPALTAMRICKSFKRVVIVASIVAVISFIIGMIASFILSTPVGASVVVSNLIIFLIFFCIGKIKAA